MYPKTVFLGDSITEGYGVSVEECWVTFMPRAVNRGISGDTTAGMLKRFPAHVIAERPERVVIMGGLNDLGEGRFWQEAAQNIQTMCEWAKREAIQPVIAICVKPDYDEFLASSWAYVLPGIRTLPEQYEQLCRCLRQYAQKHNLVCIDFAEEFPKRITGEYGRYFLEGEHPNRFGHAIMRDIAGEILYPDRYNHCDK